MLETGLLLNVVAATSGIVTWGLNAENTSTLRSGYGLLHATQRLCQG